MPCNFFHRIQRFSPCRLHLFHGFSIGYPHSCWILSRHAAFEGAEAEHTVKEQPEIVLYCLIINAITFALFIEALEDSRQSGEFSECLQQAVEEQ